MFQSHRLKTRARSLVEELNDRLASAVGGGDLASHDGPQLRPPATQPDQEVLESETQLLNLVRMSVRPSVTPPDHALDRPQLTPCVFRHLKSLGGSHFHRRLFLRRHGITLTPPATHSPYFGPAHYEALTVHYKIGFLLPLGAERVDPLG
ncbi:hypothetical protein HanIR_Chr17g0880501 [Helianthus annuus]|nr:hypothetical protein HanIR_Chr17g0880501 [Helianthus annuus]